MRVITVTALILIVSAWAGVNPAVFAPAASAQPLLKPGQNVSISLPEPWKKLENSRPQPFGTVVAHGFVVSHGIVLKQKSMPPTYSRGGTASGNSAEFVARVEASLARIVRTPTGGRLLSALERIGQLSHLTRGTPMFARPTRSPGGAWQPIFVVIAASSGLKTMSYSDVQRIDLKDDTYVDIKNTSSGRPSAVVVRVPNESVQSFISLTGQPQIEAFDVALSRQLIAAVRILAGASLAPTLVASVDRAAVAEGRRKRFIRENVPINDLLAHGGDDELALAHGELERRQLFDGNAAFRSDPALTAALVRTVRAHTGETAADSHRHLVREMFALAGDPPTLANLSHELQRPLKPIVGLTYIVGEADSHSPLTSGTFYRVPHGSDIDTRLIDLSGADAHVLQPLARMKSERFLPTDQLDEAALADGEQRLSEFRARRSAKLMNDQHEYLNFINTFVVSHPHNGTVSRQGWTLWSSLELDVAQSLVQHPEWVPDCI